ncbi:MAG: hypothetical protein OEM24_10155 [Paracoccaceae bacterium]|nr:hypothetical protein [Paracoccaceae bacterium]
MRKWPVLLGLAVAVWAFCRAIMFVGRAVTTLETTLLIHLIGAPLGAAVAAWAFQRLSGELSPLLVAASFVAVALLLDVFVVSMFIEKSFEMFGSVIGVWLPQALIFLGAWGAGLAVARSQA